jgi:hypothetical protein
MYLRWRAQQYKFETKPKKKNRRKKTKSWLNKTKEIVEYIN